MLGINYVIFLPEHSEHHEQINSVAAHVSGFTLTDFTTDLHKLSYTTSLTEMSTTIDWINIKLT